MNRFFSRILQKAVDPSEAAIGVVALGDSVTQGVMAHRVLEPGVSYLRLLQNELEEFFPNTTFNTVNAGVSGDTAEAGLRRLERDVIRHNPDLIIIAFGLNDALKGRAGLQGFAESLLAIIARCRNESSADLLLMTPPFMATRKGTQIHPEHMTYADEIIRCQCDGTLAAYAGIIRELAFEEGIALADIHAEWERLKEARIDTDTWLSNGLNHPDHRGHRLAATVVFQALLSKRGRDLIDPMKNAEMQTKE